MINKVKTFAVTVMAAGAALAATSALAKVSTNMQVLDNISVALKIYSQAPNVKTTHNGNGETIAAEVGGISTSDIIYQLGQVGGFAVNPKTDKLVLSTIYSNMLVGIPGTSVTVSSVTLTNVPQGTLFYWEDSFGHVGSLNFTDFATVTNSFLITNGVNEESPGYIFYTSSSTSAGTTVYSLPDAHGNGGYYGDSITSNALFTAMVGSPPPFTSANAIDYAALASTNINGSRALTGQGALSYWVTVVPTVSGTNVNVTITQFSPQTEEILAQADQHICVMTPKTGSADPTLFLVDNWIAWDLNSGGTTIYDETGNDLGANEFSGTNITGQTIYSTGDLLIYTVYPTNGAPATVTNLNLDPMGFSKGTIKLMNLTLNGKATHAENVQLISTETVTAGGQGFIGGTFTTDPGYPAGPNTDKYVTSITDGVTNYSTNFFTNYNSNPEITSVINNNAEGNYLGTNFVTNVLNRTPDTNLFGFDGDYGQYVYNPTNVVYSGTITLNFLSALTASNEIVPVQP
ncbi:MAG: hypothetical protein ABSA83_18165 [Verrucomicrobiota bacterium]|jgi:hypothetical protein